MVYKNKILLLIKILSLFQVLSSLQLYAKQNAQETLNLPVGILLSHIGLGVAENGDSSIVDINPALIAAIEKQYSVFGNVNLHYGLNLFEVGIMDIGTTPLAAVFKARQTTTNTNEIDRRFTLGLAYHISDASLSLGVKGDFDQYNITNWTHAETLNGQLALGILYQLNFKTTAPLFFGFSVTSLFNKFINTAYNLGISKGFAKDLYRVHVDGTISNQGKLPKVAGGLDLKIREFFCFSTSVGWNFSERVVPFGVGLWFNGPHLKAFYSLATHQQLNTDGIWQSTGIVIAF